MSTPTTLSRLLIALVALLVATPTLAQEKKSSEDERSPKAKKAAKRLSKAESKYHAGKWYKARTAYEKAYEMAPEDSPVRVKAALGRSTLLWEQGDYHAASTYIREALDLAKELNLHGAVGRLLLTLGHTQASRGQLATAEQTLQQCMQLAAEQGDPVFGPLCKLNHRLVRKLQGKAVGSKAEYKQALKQLESVDSPLTVGLSLSKTAELYADGGQRKRAFNLLDRAGQQYDEAGSVPARARNNLLKARLQQQAGQWNAARPKLKSLLKTFESMGSKPALIDILGLLGNDAQHRGAYGQAKTYYKRGFEIAKKTGSPQLQAKSRVALCDIGASTGDAALDAHCREAISTFEQLGMPQMTAQAYAARGRLAQRTDALEKARDQFVAALEVIDEKVHPKLQQPSRRRNALANLCQVEMRLQIEGAHYRCREALETMDADSVSESMLARTHYALGNSATSAGHTDEGTDHLSEAAELFESMTPPNLGMYGDTQLRLGEIYKKSGDREKAAKAFRAGLELLGDANADSLMQTKVQLRSQYAQMELARENWKSAVEQLENVGGEAKAIGDVATRAWSYSALARANNQLGENEAARKALKKALPLAKKAGDEKLVETVKTNLEQFE